MIKNNYADRRRIVEILTDSFDLNKSVSYIIKQDQKRKQRIRFLMEYSFEVCYYFGKTYLSEDKKACALFLLPDQKRITFKSILLDIKLIIFSIGISNVGKALLRETKNKMIWDRKGAVIIEN